MWSLYLKAFDEVYIVKELYTNFRTCILSKVFDKLIFKHVYNLLIDNYIIYKYQYDFLPAHFTVYQLI
jgi:hypothetical protein